MCASWFGSKPFEVQLVIVATVCDVTGAALGYAFHPQLGVDPIIGIALGLVAGSIPLGIWLLMNTQ